MKNINEMSLKEKLGQLIVAGFTGYEYNEHVRILVEEYKVANIILFSRNIKDGRQLFSLNKRLHEEILKHTGTVPLIAIDQEGGMVTRIMNDITFAPGAMTISATSLENASVTGHIMGREMISYGINLNLAPSLDVNNNPKNPVIGVRSYSDNPKKVALFGNTYIKALEEEGVLATAKHFPGHGDTSLDSHLSLPSINHDKKRLEQVELYPFKEAIKNNVSVIMSAHVFFNAYEKGNLPATLSKNVLTSLLRETLGFGGLIISDCMEMKAIDDNYTTEEGVAMGIKAGLDLACISHTLEKQIGALRKIEEAITRGEISLKQIDEKVSRILKYKEKTLPYLDKMFNQKTYEDIEDIINNKESKAKSLQIVKDSYTLYKGKLPEAGKKTLVIAPLPFAATIAEDKLSSRNLLEEIKKEVPSVDTFEITMACEDEEISKALEISKKYDNVLVCTFNALRNIGQARLVNLLSKNKNDLYVISMRSPYDIYAFDDVKNYSILYEYTPNSIKVICDLLKGKLKALGSLPINLTENPKIGASIYVGLDDYLLVDNLKYLELLKESNIDMVFISCHMPEANERFLIELKKVLEKAFEMGMKIILDVSRDMMDTFTVPNEIYSLRLDYGFSEEEIISLSNNKPYYVELNASTISKEKLERLVSKGLNLNNTRISHNFYPKPYTGLSLESVKEKNEYMKKYNLKIMAYIPSKNGKRMPLYEGLPSVESHRSMNLYAICQELKALKVDEIFFGDSFASKEELLLATSLQYDIISIPILIRKDLSLKEKELLLRLHHNRSDESEYFKRSSLREKISPNNTITRKQGDITIDNEKFLRYSGEVCIMKKDLEADERVNVVGKMECSLFLLSQIKPGDPFKFIIVGEY